MSAPLNSGSLPLLMDQSTPGRVGSVLPPLDVPAQELPDASLLREDLQLPEVTEPQVVRYFTLLSQRNFGIDTHFYPLGSCSMKYNPKVNDEIAFLPGMARIHPSQTDDTVQGALAMMHRLQTFLAEITGMTGVSLAPLAGAHGELAGMLMVRACLRDRGENQRKIVAIPDSAHGTNPASAAMAGFDVVSVASDSDGNMDVRALEDVADDRLAAVMLTLPNTLGLFDTNILELCQTVHKAGGLVYGDGANMNALLGRAKPAHLGFDVVHLNLHKTFSTPHGGGGPGAGPVCVGETLLPYLPTPVVQHDDAGYTLGRPEKSIGKLSGHHGNFGVLVRAYSYIRTLGNTGLKQVSGDAVLHANYLLACLRDTFDLPYDRTCMHEVIFSARAQAPTGVKGLDIAKRLLDYGFHAPTMYFPLIVHEALMIEPTETETKETLDAFIDAMKAIAGEVEDDPSLVKMAPHNTPVSRLDEATASRRPNLRWHAP